MQFINDSAKAEGVQVEGATAAQNDATTTASQPAATNTETTTATAPAAEAENKNPSKLAEQNAPANNEEKTAEEAKAAEEAAKQDEGKPADSAPAGEQNPQTPEQKAEAEKKANEALEAAAEARLLERLGLKSIDELKEKLNPPQELTPEQKKRNEDIAKASIQEYAVRNLQMKPEDFVEIENVKSLSDVDLVKRDFIKGWIDENKDNPEFKDKDLNVEAEYQFAEMFHTNSENASLKATGEKLISKTAAGIRKNYNDIYESAEKQYNGYQQFRANVAGYKGVVQGVLANLPKEMQFDIDGTAKVTFALDKLDKAKLEGFLVNDANLDFFVQKGSQEATARLNGLIQQYIELTHHKEIVATAIKTAHDVGLKKGGVGAKAPFKEETIPTATDTSESDLTADDRAKLRAKLSGGIVR